MKFSLNVVNEYKRWILGKKLEETRTVQFIFQGPRSIFAIGAGGGGLNKMPKAFLARAAGVSVLGGPGAWAPGKCLK